MQYQYALVIWYSKQDEAYLVQVPELPGSWRTAKRQKQPRKRRRQRFGCGSRARARWAGQCQTGACTRRSVEAAICDCGLICKVGMAVSVWQMANSA